MFYEATKCDHMSSHMMWIIPFSCGPALLTERDFQCMIDQGAAYLLLHTGCHFINCMPICILIAFCMECSRLCGVISYLNLQEKTRRVQQFIGSCIFLGEGHYLHGSSAQPRHIRCYCSAALGRTGKG